MCFVDNHDLVLEFYVEGFARVRAEQEVVWQGYDLLATYAFISRFISRRKFNCTCAEGTAVLAA